MRGWTKAEHDAAPEMANRLHRRILDLQDAGEALADAIRGLDSYAALGGAPMERTNRADAALERWTSLATDERQA